MEEVGERILFFFFSLNQKKLSRAYITNYTMGLCGSSGAFEHLDIYTFSFYLSDMFFAFAKSPKVLCKISERIECIYHQVPTHVHIKGWVGVVSRNPIFRITLFKESIQYPIKTVLGSSSLAPFSPQFSL